MPHPSEPNQIAFETTEQYNSVNTTSIREDHEFIDPRGEYAITPSYAIEGDSGASRATVEYENTGIDLRIVGLGMRASQGAETGRCAWNLGWSVSADGYVLDTVLDAVGVDAGGGRYRRGEVQWFPDDLRPLWEFKDSVYLQGSPDSGSTDTYKATAYVYTMPAEMAGSGSGSRL